MRRVPQVVGMPVDEARRALVGAGFRVTTRSVTLPGPSGVVLTQTPAAGSVVREGTTVDLAVSR